MTKREMAALLLRKGSRSQELAEEALVLLTIYELAGSIDCSAYRTAIEDFEHWSANAKAELEGSERLLAEADAEEADRDAA